MSEEEEKKQEEEKAKQEAAKADADKRDKSETVKDTERIRLETEGLNKAIAEKENADARAKIAGVTDAGIQPEKPVEETNAEYAKRVASGKI